MDTSILFNNSPNDDNKLAVFDWVVNTFFTTKNNLERETANKCLNEFKMNPDSWLFCDYVLNKSQYINSKIISLGILEDVIKTKWKLLTEDQKLGIRNFLVDMLIKNVTDDNSFANNSHLINKLNYVIVLIANYEWTSTWPTFFSEICTSSKSNQNLCENNLKLLNMLNEEINEFWKNSMTTSKVQELKTLMAKEFGAVFELCCFIFENSQNVKQSLIIEAIKLYSSYVKWFPLEFVFREDILSKFLNDFKQMTFLRVEVMKCLGEIFGLSIDVNKVGQEQFLVLKNITMQVYKNYINQMLVITNEMNLAERYFKLDDMKKLNFEEFCMQFALSLISFFKNNMAYIEEYDFITGSANGNDFTYAYLKEIYLGLNYLAQIHQIPNEEIMKATCEFWHWFCYKICFLKEKDADFEHGIPQGMYTLSLSQYILYAQEMFFYKNCYSQVLEIVRHTLITKMTKPIEVKIDIDEDGNLVMDQIINTIYQTLHETMRDCLIYLTHLDPLATEKIIIDLLQCQTIEANWNPSLLNSLCWSIGCITGAMDEMHEKKFVVMVIKYLLNLCEMKKGKTNKAIVASNIMYVVGQYPRFLNAHWKFLKTVIKKLFEFMHELHPGVQDFACETFLKISLKCGDQIVIANDGEHEPYLNVLVRSIREDTADLQAHQKLMFYEAIGNMVFKEHDLKKKTVYIQQMMQPTYNDWCGIFEQANHNPEILQHNMAIKALDLVIKINERVAYSVKTPYWTFGVHIYDNIIKAYMYYTGIINDSLNSNQNYVPALKQFKSIKKTILKFIQTVISTNDSVETIMNSILPALSNLIEAYRYSHVDNRDADVLLVFSEVLEKLKNTQFDYIVSIWNFLCLFTLEMIKSDFQSYPEHRQNFFILVKSLISNAFDALFQVQDSNFNKDVLNAIIWAIRHNQPQMYETGLETLVILIKNINQIRMVNNINIADLFYKTFYFDLIQETLCVMTDSFHKAGFKLQIEIMQFLISVVEFGQISEGLFDPSTPNKQYAINAMINLITAAFSHLNKVQIQTFCIGLFNKCYNYHEFKTLIRNFLTNLKSFAGENDELYEEDKQVQIEEARQLEEKKRNFIPGMMPVYDIETSQKIKSTNYQIFNP